MTNETAEAQEGYLQAVVAPSISAPILSIILLILSLPAVALTVALASDIGVFYSLVATFGLALVAVYMNEGEDEKSVGESVEELQEELQEIGINLSHRILVVMIGVGVLVYLNAIIFIAAVSGYLTEQMVGWSGIGVLLSLWIPLVEVYIGKKRGVAPIVILAVLPVFFLVLLVGLCQMLLIGDSGLVENIGGLLKSILKALSGGQQGSVVSGISHRMFHPLH